MEVNLHVPCSFIALACFQIAGEVDQGHQNDEGIVLFQGAVYNFSY